MPSQIAGLWKQVKAVLKPILFVLTVLLCLILPWFLLPASPWLGLLCAVAVVLFWANWGPPPFPGLLPGCLAVYITLNCIVVGVIALWDIILRRALQALLARPLEPVDVGFALAAYFVAALASSFIPHLTHWLVERWAPRRGLCVAVATGAPTRQSGIFLAVLAAVLLLPRVGYGAIIAAAIVPLAASVPAFLWLRFVDTGVRQRQFLLGPKGPVSCRGEEPFRAEFLVVARDQECQMSMVGWHYTVYGIALYGESGELAANRYTNELIFREERGRLIGEAGIPALDIRFAVLAARGSQDESIYFYPLEAPIQKVVLEELGRLPPEERAWWEALLCKRLGNRTDAAVSAADLRRAAAQLSAVIPGEEARRGIIALKRLAEMSDPVCVVSDAAYDSFAKQKLGTPSDSIYYMDHYLRTHSKA